MIENDDEKLKPNKGIASEFATTTKRVVDMGSDELVRTNSIDALRGWAIFGMALSGMIPFGILPNWMYHCQVPSPDHVFNPKIPGITWVDLVFPFFLFSMGAAMPLAFQRFGNDGISVLKLVGKLFGRFFMLGFFAFWIEMTRFSQHTKDPQAYLNLVLPAYLVLFLIYWKPPKDLPSWITWITIPAGLLAAYKIAEPIIKPVLDSKTAVFGIDIILAVLANIAFFGGLIVYLTRSCTWVRWIIVAGTAWLFVNKSFPTFITEMLTLFPKARGLHQPEFLKYLMLTLIGAQFGELAMRWPAKAVATLKPDQKLEQGSIKGQQWLLLSLSVFIVVVVTALLFWRKSVDSVIVSAVFGGSMLGIVWRWPELLGKTSRTWMATSLIVLLVGLGIEIGFSPIQKDPTSLSYFFVTAGLAGILLFGLQIFDQDLWPRKHAGMIALVGQNALLGYATITHLAPIIWKKGGIENALLDFTLKHPALGFGRGLLETMLVILIVALLTKLKFHLRA